MVHSRIQGQGPSLGLPTHASSQVHIAHLQQRHCAPSHCAHGQGRQDSGSPRDEAVYKDIPCDPWPPSIHSFVRFVFLAHHSLSSACAARKNLTKILRIQRKCALRFAKNMDLIRDVESAEIWHQVPEGSPCA